MSLTKQLGGGDPATVYQQSIAIIQHCRHMKSTRWASRVTRIGLVWMMGMLPFLASAQTRPNINWMAGGHVGLVRSVAYSPDGQILASGSWTERTIKLWRVSDGMLVRT